MAPAQAHAANGPNTTHALRRWLAFATQGSEHFNRPGPVLWTHLGGRCGLRRPQRRAASWQQHSQDRHLGTGLCHDGRGDARTRLPGWAGHLAPQDVVWCVQQPAWKWQRRQRRRLRGCCRLCGTVGQPFLRCEVLAFCTGQHGGCRRGRGWRSKLGNARALTLHGAGSAAAAADAELPTLRDSPVYHSGLQSPCPGISPSTIWTRAHPRGRTKRERAAAARHLAGRAAFHCAALSS